MAALIIIPGVVNGLTPDAPTGRPPVSQGQQGQEPAEEVVEEDTTVEIPDMVGMTVADAVAALAAVNVTLDLPADIADDWIVTSQTVPGGDRIEPGDPLSIAAEAPKPKMTPAQESALQSAQSYMRTVGGFSRQGLIEQLEYEQFSTADATFAVDNGGFDWAAAADSAASYMETVGGFSRGSLIDQLLYEGFTQAEAEHGANSVGL